jgi:S-DNA-T family DNA segregation ATPase FtsK/SpoIIIE
VRAACIAAYPEPLASRDEPPSGASRPRPDARGRFGESAPATPIAKGVASASVSDDAGRAEASELAQRIEASFRQAHVVVQMKPPLVGARIVSFEISAPRGRIRKVDSAAEDVEHRLASEHDVTAVYRRHGGIRTFEVARRTARKVTLGPLLHAKSAWLAEQPGRFVLGENIRGEAVVGDFSDHVSCHMLVGGSAGSGKSVLLRAIATSLVYFHPPSAIQLTLVDPKRVTFGGAFKSQIGAHLAQPVCHDTEATITVLERLVEEMEERYAIFQDASVEDCQAYNEQAAPNDRLPRHVVIVDEFADLTVDKASREPFFEAVRRLGNMARAAGIHLVLATQRPDAKTVPGTVRTNLSAKVALRVPNQTSSRIILDQGGAEKLLGNGDLLADLGHGLVRAQGAMA